MKISIIGCGRVGTTSAYAIMLKALASEIALVDVDSDKSKGEELDLIHGTAEVSNVKITSGGYEKIVGSNIVVITAGIPRKPGETRLQLAAKNIDVIKNIAEQVHEHAPDAFVLVVSNPVDIMTYITQKVFGDKKDKVFGLGNVLDQLRYRSMLGRELNVHPQSVDAMIIGEHGDSMVVLEDSIKVNGLPFEHYGTIDEERMKRIIHNTIYGGAQVIALKGGTYYSVAIAICQVIEAIVNDTKEILPVSFTRDFEGRQVPFSLPTVVGKEGIVKTIEMPLGEEKQALLTKSVNAISEMIDQLNI